MASKTYLTSDGETIAAANVNELVRLLWRHSHGGETRVEWKKSVARRVLSLNRKRVRVSSDAQFVRDLIRVGIIKEQK